MNSVVDEVLNPSSTDNKIKYRITHADNTTELVQIELATEVTVEGTPLNKLLFDSIEADLNSRLLVSDKATQAEAEAGTNDAHYMTPLKTQQKIDYLTSYVSKTTGGSLLTENIVTFTDNNKTYLITGCLKNGSTSSSARNQLIINGTGLAGKYDGSISTGTSATLGDVITGSGITGSVMPFYFIVDTKNKSIMGVVGTKHCCYSYTTLSNIQVNMRGGDGTSYQAHLDCSIQVNK